MPSLNDIKQFNRVLTQIGSEPEILAERSEEIEEVTPPEQDLSQDLKELLETAPPKGMPSAEGAPAEAGEISEGMPSAGGEAEEGPPSELPELDFESLFGEQEAEGAGEELAEGLDELPDEFQEAAPQPPAEEGLPEAPVPAEEGLPQEEAPPLAEEIIPPEVAELPEQAPFPEEVSLPEEPMPEEEAFQPPEELLEGLEVEAAQVLPEEERVPEQEVPGEIAVGGELEPPLEEVIPEDLEFPEMGPTEEEAPEEAIAEEGLPELIMETAGGEVEEGAPEPSPEVTPPEEEELFQPPEELLEGLDVEAEETAEAVAPPAEQLGEEFFEEAAEAEAEAAGEAEPPVEEEISLSGELEEMQGLEAGPAEMAEEDFQIDEFALPGMEEQVPAAEEEAAAGAPAAGEEAEVGLPPAEMAPPEIPEEGIPAEEIPEAERAYTDEEFDAIKEGLAGLPLNLKIAVEELIGENQLSDADQSQLLDALIAATPPLEIAELASRLSGREIQLPRRFEKKTGIAFELERRTFRYAFRENIVPILRVFVPAAVVVFALSMAVNSLIIRPLRANGLYNQGYNLIPEERFVEAEEKFDTAFALNPVKGWFYTYAERYIEQNQITKAEQKYELLLQRYPNDKRGLLDYAKLYTQQMQYRKAEERLEKILEQDAFDYEALLASGDNYLEWAKRDETYYDKARDAYLRILRGKEGVRDEPWLHMLRYYIRTDNLAEVERIKNRFEADKGKKIDPEIYTGLGGYLISKGKLDDVKSILSRSMKAKRNLPQTYYQFSRFFKETGDTVKEREALTFTLNFLDEASSSPERLGVRIKTYNRLGEIYYKMEEYLNAEKEFKRAIDLIRDGREQKTLPEDPEFGRVFYNSGNIHYYIHHDLDISKALFEEAKEYGLEEIELNYKLGYINYVRGDYEEALLEFYQIATQYRNNRNLLYSIANTLYNRTDFFAAQGYYNRLLDILEDERRTIPLLRPQEDAEHRSLVEILMKSYNNLGVTLKRLSESPRNLEKETKALVQLTRSSEFFDLLSRDLDTLRRGETKNLAYLNMRGILYPQADFLPQIYERIPKDSEATQF